MKKIPRFIPPLTVHESLAALIPRKAGQADGTDAVRAFARRFAQFIGVSYAVPAPSARVALAGLLHALELPRKGEVILPSLTFHAFPAMFQEFGLRPRFVDIDPSTYCIDTDRLEHAITPSTVAVVPVHLYGRACNMDAITSIADRHGLVVIEDCAQCCGGFYADRRLGSFGRGATFSFAPAKNLSALWAGMVVTDSPELAAKVASWMDGLPRIGKAALARRLLFALGMRMVTRPWFWSGIMDPALGLLARAGVDPIESLTSEGPGAKRKPDKQSRLMPRPYQGRVGLGQLEKLDALNRLRIRNGDLLLERLRDVSGIDVPAPAPEGENIYMSFIVRIRDRDEFRRRMLRLGVDTHSGNMHVGPHLPGLEGTGEADVAADAVKRMVHLPVYPELSESEVARVAEAVALSR